MLAVSELAFLLFDMSLRTAGALVFAAIAWRTARSSRWRNPLGSHGWSAGGPTYLDIAGVYAFYLILLWGLLQCFQLDRDQVVVPGSHAWHLAQCFDAAAKLAACAVMIFILYRVRSSHKVTMSESRITLGGWATALIGAVLIIFSISYTQLQTGAAIWRWIVPDAVLPEHPVLEAIEHSAWGGWGAVQLTLTAIVFAPLAEELFFRGLLLQTFWRHLGHAWLAIALSATAFGLIHITQPQNVLPLVSMGIILGYVRMRLRSLTACVVIHALFNTRTMLFVLLNPELARQPW